MSESLSQHPAYLPTIKLLWQHHGTYRGWSETELEAGLRMVDRSDLWMQA